MKIDKDQLLAITEKLKEEVWISNYIDWEASLDLVDIISSLHNLLYEAVTGDLYDYAWHWTNKIGEWTDDHCFDELIGRKKKNEDL